MVGWWLIQSALPLYAAPYFSVEGTDSGEFGKPQTWLVKLHSQGEQLTAVQTVVNFDNSLFAAVQLSNLDSKCSFWGPPDPSLGYGNLSTPYFYDYEKIVISCGFSNPGYITTKAGGDLILSFTLVPYFVGVDGFTFTNSAYRYVGTTISPGYDPVFVFNSVASISADVTISADILDATASYAPAPTPVPFDTLSASELQLEDYSNYFKNLKNRIGTQAYSLLTQGLGLVPLDDTIPPPPTDLEKRPSATPMASASGSAKEEGEVLSLQSLRELLVPGKSDADKRLVVFNLIATLTFLILLAVLIWRLAVSSRMNRIKYRHMKEMIEGEISVLQSKLEGIKNGGSNEDVMKSLDELRKELEKQK